MERASQHPIAKAVLAEAESRSILLDSPQEAQTTPGQGASCVLGDQTVRVGKRSFIGDVPIEQSLGDKSAELERQAKTVLWVANDEHPIGLIAVSDGLKPEAADVIRSLRESGLGVTMLTGDNAHTARAIAQRVGIDKVSAEVLPSEKSERIRVLQRRKPGGDGG